MICEIFFLKFFIVTYVVIFLSASGAWCYNGEGTVPRYELCDIPTCAGNIYKRFFDVQTKYSYSREV